MTLAAKTSSISCGVMSCSEVAWLIPAACTTASTGCSASNAASASRSVTSHATAVIFGPQSAPASGPRRLARTT
jgi:hypothetical protein